MKSKSALLEALADVKEIRRRVLDRQLFCGYSGHARIAGGFFALIGALLLLQNWIPRSPDASVVVWGAVCAIAATVNFSALLLWYMRRESELAELRPVLDVVPPFIVGGLLTSLALVYSAYDMLFPIWMWLFGLMNISSRHSMPTTMVYLGWFYIACGTVCMVGLPSTSFTNPLPMGLSFFIGELIGGFAFLKLRKEEV